MGSNLDALGQLVAHGMVGAAVAEFQLVSLAADGQAEQLVTETDAEDGLFADQFPDIRDLGLERLRVARAIREKDSIRVEGQDVFGGGQRGNYSDAAAHLHQAAQN